MCSSVKTFYKILINIYFNSIGGQTEQQRYFSVIFKKSINALRVEVWPVLEGSFEIIYSVKFIYELSHFETDSYRRPPLFDTPQNAHITLFSANLRLTYFFNLGLEWPSGIFYKTYWIKYKGCFFIQNIFLNIFCFQIVTQWNWCKKMLIKSLLIPIAYM